jgi:CO/xanthine dehydrogenase FAD-binding subunit
LIALGAAVETSKRTVDAEDFFGAGVGKTTVLDSDEIVTAIRVPRPPDGARSAFSKFALRRSIDFAIVNCAAMITISGGDAIGARICLNAVDFKPRRALEAEESIRGKFVDEEKAEAAGAAAVSGARPMSCNGYMVQIARTLVKRTILACR